LTRTLRARLVLVLGAVVAAACLLLITLAMSASAVLLRREQDRTLQSEAIEQCEGMTSESRNRGVGLPAGAKAYFDEAQTGTRVDLLDSSGTLLVTNGEVDDWSAGDTTFRERTAPCGKGYVVRAIARDVLAESSVRRVAVVLLAALPIALGIGIAMGGAAIARALRPLDDLEQAASRLTATSPLSLGVGARPLEIARLEQSIDSLLERLGAALSRERRFTQEASHELRTPLTALHARIERLSTARGEADRAEHVAAIARELHSLETLVDALLLLARAEDAPLPRVPVNVCDLARSAARRQGLVDGARSRPIDVEAPDEILVRGHEELLDRAIGNVVENARKFAGAKGRIRLRVASRAGLGVISVADDGPGIAAERRAQIFERFYRDPAHRQSSDGAGLGLAVVRAIIARHGGRVSAGASDLGGADLTLELPLL
jgi:signal transduction histidine kinase